jgi:hypothetical protein
LELPKEEVHFLKVEEGGTIEVKKLILNEQLVVKTKEDSIGAQERESIR